MDELVEYSIALHGCDDSTFIKMNLSDSEAQLLKRVADATVEESSYGCMPIMEIKEIDK